MRIRKRSESLGFGTISTTESQTDPPLTTRKLEEVEEDNKRLQLHPCFGDQHQSHQMFKQVHQTSGMSDLELTFIRGKEGWVCCGDDDGDREMKKKQDEFLCMMNRDPCSKMVEKELKELKDEEEEEKMIKQGGFGSRTATKNRKCNSLDSEEEEEGEVNDSGFGVPPFPFPSNISSDHHHHQVHERWCEGVKGFPLKKRRGSNCERKVMGEEQMMIMEMKQKKPMKKTANPNKKMLLLDSVKKKEGGARCSRINGRGWRCCQQTLMGYSLCEHHSGKRSRLKSMNSVRNRSSIVAVSSEKCEDEDEEMAMRNEEKKRKKMGMVKARSIRSLLGQAQNDDYVSV